MAAWKLIFNSIGIAMTMIGVYIIYANSPINSHVIDAGRASADFSTIERTTKRRNQSMRAGVYIVLAGSLLQLVSNFMP